MTNYRQVGEKLGEYIRGSNPTTQQIQGLLADLLAGDDLLVPMREVVSRPAFAPLQAFAGRRGGAIQRDALVQELSRSYLPSVVDKVRLVLDGVLDTKDDPDRKASNANTPSPPTTESRRATKVPAELQAIAIFASPLLIIVMFIWGLTLQRGVRGAVIGLAIGATTGYFNYVKKNFSR